MRTMNRNDLAHAPVLGAIGIVAATAILASCSAGGVADPPQSRPKHEIATAPVIAVRAPAPPPEPTPPTPAQLKAAWQDGVALFDAKRYGEASSKLQLVAAARVDDAYAHYLLGLSLWKSGQPAAAELSLERSTVIDPQATRTWVNLARVRLELEDLDGAAEAADAALRIDPASATARHQKGRALASLNRTDEALEALRIALESDPQNGYIANTIGYVLIRANKPAEAVPYLEAARATLPGIDYVRNNLGVAYERTGLDQSAIEEFRAAVEAGDASGKAAASLVRLQRPLTDETAVARQPETLGDELTVAAIDPQRQSD